MEIILIVDGRERRIGGKYISERERIERGEKVFSVFGGNFKIVGVVEFSGT